ncbi:phosphate signaling complex protein PhoU [Lysobacter sp. HDW10]|uniref:phosphate signaling complex protein PhoU n=1 Tax=Lysobacter sp. HDW10 TaxID=2714936 RepID=UPI00140A9480|nr:phosphate signaling complex protein PhoU [Lysobacter sp. HDW10]QIK80149.1 phosphate signaling complex protein PhoU [Lysobacter sp. HDW10]
MANTHLMSGIEEEHARLRSEIERMGEMAIAQLEAALDVIARRDDRAAQRIVANDDAIDALEQQVSEDVMKLATGGPLASDLRAILSSLRIASDIERVGDYASNLAKRAIALNAAPALPVPHVVGLDALGRLAVQQLRNVMKAYSDLDPERAMKVREDDAALDMQYTGIFRELLTYMMEDPRNITSCTHLLFMAKNIERIGDHATNIAENIVYRVHGPRALPRRTKMDDSNTMHD